MANGRSPAPVRFAKFFDVVDHPDACWEWKGSRDRHGYGLFCDGIVPEKHMFAHRFAMQTCAERIDPSIKVLHRCDNPCCVRPAHLFLGSQADNIADMYAKGRQRSEDSKARGSQIASSKIDEQKAAEIKSHIDAAPRSKTGRLRKGVLLRIARDTQVSRHIVAHISCGSWRHVQGALRP